jgi:hypothetical protein
VCELCLSCFFHNEYLNAKKRHLSYVPALKVPIVVDFAPTNQNGAIPLHPPFFFIDTKHAFGLHFFFLYIPFPLELSFFFF